MERSAVKIGPRFFEGAFRDYRDWRWALGREYAQNSFDCGSTKIVVTIEDFPEQKQSKLVWLNNGAPMTKEILVDKLLSLGGTGKGFEGTVGGFGKAKELLLFCHIDWQIRTGEFLVQGIGGEYTIEDGQPFLNGSEFTVTMNGIQNEELSHQFKRYITLSQWRGIFILNGEIISQRLNKGNGRKDLTYGRIYTNSDHAELMVVRIDGTPMFTKYAIYKGCVVLELNGKSADVLQASRDSLKWEFGNELDNFMVSLAVNKLSALKDNTPTIEKKRYRGYKLQGSRKTIVSTHQDDAPDIEAGEIGVLTAALATVKQQVTAGTGVLKNPTNLSDISQVTVHPDFFLKNVSGMKTPNWFTPDGFSEYSKNLIWRWMACLVALADITENKVPFSIGFIIDEECEAQYEKEGNDRVIYINPSTIVRMEGKPASMQCKWKFDQDGIWNFIAICIHEWVHHEGFSNHDESYAGRLTELTGLVLARRTIFSKIFQQKVIWPE